MTSFNGIRTVSLFSNYLNEHQLPLCLELSTLPSIEEFHFVSLDRNLEVVGRQRLDDTYPFVIRAYESSDAKQKAMLHATNDDVVVFGDMAGEEDYVQRRMHSDALTFRYAERLLKRGLWWRYLPQKVKRTNDWFIRYSNQNFYCLCASAFTSFDLSLFGFPIEKCFKWGYFPTIENVKRSARNDDLLELLWVGRLIGWKRPALALEVSRFLVDHGVTFRLRMIGEGRLSGRLQTLARRCGLDGYVDFCGELDRSEVCRLMSESDILLMTSNRKEGWGAVINEAMSYGCVVVASDIAGAAPFLIKDGENGFLYAADDVRELCQTVLSLAGSDRGVIEHIGENARQTILQLWNANEAANRLIELANTLQENDRIPYEEGPCSPAGVIPDDWFIQPN